MIWETVQGFGAIVGIVTGGFVIWERFFRYQPAMFLVSAPMLPKGAYKACYLRVINRSERPIIISWPTGLAKDEIRISADHSTRAIVGSLLHGQKAIVIDGKSDMSFPVHTPTNWHEIGTDQTIDVVVNWQFVQPLIWKKERSVRVRITKRAFILLQGNEDDEA
nr:hypothetical protein REQ54_01113 [Rhizobium sp. Q54]